jgi:hypothetical protein
MRAALILLVLLGSVPFAARQAAALQFESVDASPTEVMIGARGPIVAGDAGRLDRTLAELPPGKRLLGIELDSPGGSVAEASQLANMIRTRKLAVGVPANAKCASACFLLLAAAPRRFAATDALVGVHGASDEGNDSEVAQAATTSMAREAGALGVPPAIIGKMTETAPQRMEWLLPSDLAAMGVTVVADGNVLNAARQTATTANFAKQQRPVALQSAPQTVAAEFQGAVFCGPQPTHLSLKLLQTPDPTHGRALYTLSGGPAGTTVPSGTFGLEGRLDLLGGTIDLRPDGSVSQTSGFGLVGLQGRSIDGGRTFTGRVTANPRCTSFTLKRSG